MLVERSRSDTVVSRVYEIVVNLDSDEVTVWYIEEGVQMHKRVSLEDVYSGMTREEVAAVKKGVNLCVGAVFQMEVDERSILDSYEGEREKPGDSEEINDPGEDSDFGEKES